MERVVTVRNVKIGVGIPKICVPIVGRTKGEILAQAEECMKTNADLVEWRVDWFEKVFEISEVIEMARALREVVQNRPILFTFRTAKEGGEKDVDPDTYTTLNKQVVASGLVDLIDVELFIGESYVRNLIEAAHSEGVKVIASSHEFHRTPSKEEMIKRLCKMQSLGADIPKLAVMPQDKRDVLRLLETTNEMCQKYANCPIITMSMAGLGAISRVSGELFGSALTFGAVKKASAPGQLEVAKLSKVLEILHGSMK